MEGATCSQFHQRFTRAFFVQNFGAKNYKADCFSFVFGFEIFGGKISAIEDIEDKNKTSSWMQNNFIEINKNDRELVQKYHLEVGGRAAGSSKLYRQV